MRLSIFETSAGVRYEALVPSESTLLACGLDLRDYGVRLASSVRSANLLVITDNENIATLQTPLNILHSQMSHPVYVLFISSKNNQWVGDLRINLSLYGKKLSSKSVIAALSKLDNATENAHSHTELNVMLPSEHVGHDMNMVDDPHAGHDMSSMDHSGHGTGSFMSMASMTEGQPRSRDGLIMESSDVVFGPFHPAVPPGWQLKLILDGDSVESATLNNILSTASLKTNKVVTETYDVFAWLLRLGDVLGWLQFTNSVRQLLVLHANSKQKSQLQANLSKLTRQVHRNQFVRTRLKGLGIYDGHDAWYRLTSTVDGLATNKPVLPRLPLVQEALPKLLVDLELGDALLVTASFYLEVNN